MLEDYAHLADGLLALYEATFDERWFTTARGLMDRVLARFADPAGGFFDTADDHERLVTRPEGRPGQRHRRRATRWRRHVLLRLAALDRRGPLPDRRPSGRSRTVVPFVGPLPDRRSPSGCRRSTSPSSDVAEVAIVGRPDEPGTRALARGGRGAATGPNQVVAAGRRPGRERRSRCSRTGSRVDGRPTAYVCRDFACRLPVTDPEALRAQLEDAGACRRDPMPAASPRRRRSARPRPPSSTRSAS